MGKIVITSQVSSAFLEEAFEVKQIKGYIQFDFETSGDLSDFVAGKKVLISELTPLITEAVVKFLTKENE